MIRRPRNLTILSSETVATLPNGQISITQKTVDGVLQYGQFWTDPITLLMEKRQVQYDNIGQLIIDRSELPFKLEIVDFSTIQDARSFDTNAVVLAGVSYQQNHIGQVCQTANLPCIYLAEYSLKTRKQIVATSTKNPLLRLRRNLWQHSQERKQRRSIATASGIQCNGTPTYEAYRSISPNPLLFFDTRMTEGMTATEAEIANRYRNREADRPLRLLFSGRLIKMKGADHLLKVAQRLKRSGVRFELYICGEGQLKPEIERQIQAQGLQDCVRMMGVLDFKTELVPFAKETIDLFVCCHRQGDPSCTYLETMACGVPIVGYANEAFEGIVAHSGAGWVVPMDRPDSLANKIAELSDSLPELQEMSVKALHFAKQNTFEKTFNRRINHIYNVIDQAERAAYVRPSNVPALL
jgi:colanic acid/amylovoran biosynthesis glycosyltransferase